MKNFIEKLNHIIEENNSFLCIGLDTDHEKLPVKSKNIYKSIYNFNKTVIDNTSDLVCCYKINSAFYEQYGHKGIEILQKTKDYIPNKIPVILDAKRCDIGNSSAGYAKYAFEYINADAVTVLPYMGMDAVEPFFKYKEKFVFFVVLSSNPGGADFQLNPPDNPLFLRVIKKINEKYPDAGFVFGATKPEYVKKIRDDKINNLLLIPGLGAQGGDVEKTVKYAFLNNNKGIFNVSRGIIYSGEGKKYFQTVREKAEEYRDRINSYKSV